MDDTRFRTWIADLCKAAGDRPDWPLLMQWMLQEQLETERAVSRRYRGERILISRIDHDYTAASAEKRATNVVAITSSLERRQTVSALKMNTIGCSAIQFPIRICIVCSEQTFSA